MSLPLGRPRILRDVLSKLGPSVGWRGLHVQPMQRLKIDSNSSNLDGVVH